MTRRIVYGLALSSFLAAIALTLAAIIIPEWISYTTKEPSTQPIHYTYGLHHRCNSIDGSCSPYPRDQDCHGANRHFCNLWRTTGFLMTFSAVGELCSLVAFAIVLLGGKQKRERGWKVLASLLALCAVGQIAAMWIVDTVLEDDTARFGRGWELARCWYLCVASYVVLLATAIGMCVASLVLPEEGGYELIPDFTRT